VQKPFNDHFICSICVSVVSVNAVECSQCQKLNCKKCIDLWQDKSKTCPNCRAVVVPNSKPNRFVYQSLEEMLFKCGQCSLVYKYSDKDKHYQNCQFINLKCPITGCQEKGTKEWLINHHWVSSC